MSGRSLTLPSNTLTFGICQKATRIGYISKPERFILKNLFGNFYQNSIETVNDVVSESPASFWAKTVNDVVTIHR